MRGLNLGSGQRRFDTAKGWINLDVTVRKPDQIPDIVANGGSLPFSADAFDFVVLHHVLEHFGCGEANGLIREAHRVLRKGGSLYIFVPDLRALAIRWITGRLDTQIYLTNLYGAYQGLEGDRHHWGFDRCYIYDWLRTVAEWNAVLILKEPPMLEGASIAWDWWILGVEGIKCNSGTF